jgi:hypothetical protein
MASSVLDLGLLLPAVGLALSLVSVLCLLLFNVLVARRLFRLSRGATAHSANLPQPGLRPRVPSWPPGQGTWNTSARPRSGAGFHW